MGIGSKRLGDDVGVHHTIADDALLSSSVLHVMESLYHLASPATLQPELIVPECTHLHARAQC